MHCYATDFSVRLGGSARCGRWSLHDRLSPHCDPSGANHSPIKRHHADFGGGLFGVPVVIAVAQAAVVSHTVAAGALSLDIDTTGTGAPWSENAGADTFAKNEIVARREGRFATSVYAPLECLSAT